jgi:hypothetical protein
MPLQLTMLRLRVPLWVAAAGGMHLMRVSL